MADHRHLARAIDTFYALDQNLTIYQMMAFTYAMTNEAGTQKGLEDVLGINPGSVNRAIRVWTEFEKYPDKPGHNFIEVYPDPADRRLLRLSLTPKGRAFVLRLREAMGDLNVRPAT